MDELSIFVVGNIDWGQFVAAIVDVVGFRGKKGPDEEYLQHQWLIDEFELNAMANPDYEDDCGIPFASYSHQILFLDGNATFEESRVSKCVDLVKSVAKSLGEEVRNELVIVRNLQSFVE